MTHYQEDEKLIIANCSGFFGDRFSAAKEMIEGGRIDVLTGDYLAELTMAILFKMKSKDPDRGYVPTFLKQMEQIMSQCLEKKIRVVTNAGGLNPKALADALQKVADSLGLKPKIAYIEGDDLMPRLSELQEKGELFTHLDKGISLKDARAKPISANAYTGGWGIAEALEQGADIVVTGRVSDASLVTGPSAWKFGWKIDDWDKLAGAVAAGHIIECGTQATGGNYSFIEEIPSFKNMGFPIACMHEDGSCIITKHPGTGGLVSTGTVTAQLMYEIREPNYLNPDVIASFDTLTLTQKGPDRVLVSGAKGAPPTDTTKVCLNIFGGFKNTMTVVLTGLDIKKKAEIVEQNLFDSLGGKENFLKTDVSLVRIDKKNPETNEEASAHLRITVIDSDPKKAGKLFSSKVVEMALANIPGFTLTSPPTDASPAIIHWPTLISVSHIQQKVFVDSQEIIIETPVFDAEPPVIKPQQVNFSDVPQGNTTQIPLGRLFATRSGDKGGNANLGIWAKTLESFAFLTNFLTTEKLKELLPDMKEFEIERYDFPNLYALNFYIKGVLGDGVAASTRVDPQAKTLGEYLRSKIVDIPENCIG